MTKRSKETENRNEASEIRQKSARSSETIFDKVAGTMMFPMLALSIAIALFFEPASGILFL